MVAAFVDVFPEETFQKNAFESYKESAEADSFKEPVVIDYVSWPFICSLTLSFLFFNFLFFVLVRLRLLTYTNGYEGYTKWCCFKAGRRCLSSIFLKP